MNSPEGLVAGRRQAFLIGGSLVSWALIASVVLPTKATSLAQRSWEQLGRDTCLRPMFGLGVGFIRCKRSAAQSLCSAHPLLA